MQTVQEEEDPHEEEHLDGQEKTEAAAVVGVGRAAAVLQGEHPVQLEETEIKEAAFQLHPSFIAVFFRQVYSTLVSDKDSKRATFKCPGICKSLQNR